MGEAHERHCRVAPVNAGALGGGIWGGVLPVNLWLHAPPFTCVYPLLIIPPSFTQKSVRAPTIRSCWKMNCGYTSGYSSTEGGYDENNEGYAGAF